MTASVFPYPIYREMSLHPAGMQSLAGFKEDGMNATVRGTARRVSVAEVTGNYYQTLEVHPQLGRAIQPTDDAVPSAGDVAVISDGLWSREFGRSPAVLGQTITVNQSKLTIVGVNPPGFTGAKNVLESPDLFVPISLEPLLARHREKGSDLSNPDFWWVNVVGRVKPGVAESEAEQGLGVQFESAVRALATVKAGDTIPRLQLANGSRGLHWADRMFRKPMLVLQGLTGLVLLLACANLSGLLLARAASRQREISIRLAMGAGAGRLIRQFLAESLVLAALGGCTGLVLAGWFSATLVRMMANGGRLLLSTAPDGRVLGFTAVLSLAACVAAGLAPGIHALRANLNPGLKEARGGGHRKLSRVLVIAQLSISMVLLVGATLFVGTLVKLYGGERGVRTDGVLTFGVKSMVPYPQPRGRAVQAAVLERLGALPGVAVASAASGIPMDGGGWTRGVQVGGYKFRADESEEVEFNVIAPRFFATVGTPLVAGREFEDRDASGGRRVAFVNESFARYFFGGESALGRRVTSANVAYEIIGVVKDVRTSLRHDAVRTLYVPWMQREGEQPRNYRFLARVAGGDPMRLVSSLDGLLREADPGLRVVRPQSFAAFVDGTIVTERIMATLGGVFGLLALTVACLGIFGVTAFQVSRRINEIGLRMALGARRGNIVLLVLREVAANMVAGCAIGAAAALTLTGLAREMLFGLTAQEPGVFGVAAALLCAAAIAAAWLPARRASRVDPMTALRHE